MNLYLIVEGPTDSRILMTVLDVGRYSKTRFVQVSGQESMSSYARTLRLMIDRADKIIIVFDADTSNSEEADYKESMMRYLSKADYSPKQIGVFSFVPDIESIFPTGSYVDKRDREALKRLVLDNLSYIHDNPTVKRIQEFINE